MEDKQIVDLFWQRSEAAIVAAASKYGKYCSKIAYNILQNYEDIPIRHISFDACNVTIALSQTKSTVLHTEIKSLLYACCS